MACGDRERQAADLVGRVAVGRDPVRADQHDVRTAADEDGRRGAVDDQPERRPHPGQLPGGEPGALQQRSRLERERLLEHAARVELADHAEGGAALDRRQRPGVADRHRAHARPGNKLRDQVGAAGRDRCARLDVLVADPHGLGEHGAGPVGQAGQRAVDAPGEVDRRRPGRAKAGRRPRPRSASSPGWPAARSATPNPPATPRAGAPRTASRWIASISSSTPVIRSTTRSSGRRVWSMRWISPSTQSMVRMARPCSQAEPVPARRSRAGLRLRNGGSGAPRRSPGARTARRA